MAYRVVTGTHFRSDNTPFAGYQVWFTLKPGGFSSTTNYPRNRVIAIVGTDGKHHPRSNLAIDGIELWVSEEAADRTEYRCQLPDGRIAEFELDAGLGPIDLTTLLTQDISPDPMSPGDLATEEVEALLAAHNNNPLAHSGLNPGVLSLTVSQSDLVGGKVLLLHGLGTDRLYLRVFDSDGDLDLISIPVGLNYVEVDFTGLTPLTQTYTVTIEAY